MRSRPLLASDPRLAPLSSEERAPEAYAEVRQTVSDLLAELELPDDCEDTAKIAKLPRITE
jgi:hypothetical protein